jgi:hypothetical protein
LSADRFLSDCDMTEKSDAFQYDIFSGSPKSGALWLERVQGCNAAVERMHVIAKEKPDMYFVFGGSERHVVAEADIRPKRERKPI